MPLGPIPDKLLSGAEGHENHPDHTSEPWNPTTVGRISTTVDPILPNSRAKIVNGRFFQLVSKVTESI
jgi:hypothetical protein